MEASQDFSIFLPPNTLQCLFHQIIMVINKLYGNLSPLHHLWMFFKTKSNHIIFGLWPYKERTLTLWNSDFSTCCTFYSKLFLLYWELKKFLVCLFHWINYSISWWKHPKIGVYLQLQRHFNICCISTLWWQTNSLEF